MLLNLVLVTAIVPIPGPFTLDTFPTVSKFSATFSSKTSLSPTWYEVPPVTTPTLSTDPSEAYTIEPSWVTYLYDWLT